MELFPSPTNMYPCLQTHFQIKCHPVIITFPHKYILSYYSCFNMQNTYPAERRLTTHTHTHTHTHTCTCVRPTELYLIFYKCGHLMLIIIIIFIFHLSNFGYIPRDVEMWYSTIEQITILSVEWLNRVYNLFGNSGYDIKVWQYV
jgi:hypothetical protein